MSPENDCCSSLQSLKYFPKLNLRFCPLGLWILSELGDGALCCYRRGLGDSSFALQATTRVDRAKVSAHQSSRKPVTNVGTLSTLPT